MATIRKLPSGRFNVQIRRKGTPPISQSFDTHDEALQFVERHEETQFQRAFQQKAELLSFIKTGEQYCQIVLGGRPSQDITLYRVRLIAKHLPDDMRAISKADVNSYRLMRLRSVASVTCRDELQLVHRIYKYAHRELLLDPNQHPSPCKDISMPPASRPRSRVVEKDELKRLLCHLSPVMSEIVELAFETAMRRGEIIKLRKKHVHLKARVVSVIDGKTGDRDVPLSKRALGLLQMAVERHSSPDAALYPVTAHAVSTALRRARSKAGLDSDVRMHQLRHTRITMVARKGFNQAQIMMVSGHRDSRSVQRYTHLNVRDVVALLD